MKKLGYLILGVLVAIAGASFAQSYTEFLNLRAIESIDLQGNLADSTGSLTINDSVDISGALAVTGDITDASLSANVPLLNAATNTFTGNASFGGSLTIGTDLSVANGGTGASTLTGLLQGNGTSAFTAVTNSTIIGQTLRVTGSNTYGWGALNLADPDAITGDIPDANLSGNVPLLNALNGFTANQNISANLAVNPDSTGSNELNVSTDLILVNGTFAADAAGGNDELTVSSGTVAMIGTITGGASGGIDITPVSGTFTASFADACTTTPTITFDYQQIGNLVSMHAVSSTGFDCTSDSTSFVSGANVPSGIRPWTGTYANAGVFSGFLDNGASASAVVNVQSGGAISFDRMVVSGSNVVAGGWTSSGLKSAPAGVNGLTITYMLGNP